MNKQIWIIATLPLAVAAENLTLTENTTIDVAEGQTTTYERLASDGAFTLTKTGTGKLVFNTIDAPQATLALQGGTVEVALGTTPAALANATIYLDASDETTMTLGTNEKGETIVTKWADMNGSTVHARQSLQVNTNVKACSPILVASPVAGRKVIDLGELAGDPKGCHPTLANTYGASFVLWANDDTPYLTAQRDFIAVARDKPELKTAIEDYGLTYNAVSSRGAPIFGNNTMPVTFYRNNRTEPNTNSGILNWGATFDGKVLVDRAEVANSTPMPDGFHLFEFAMNSDTGVGYLGRDRTVMWGAMQLAAAAIFKEQLSAADRQSVSDYLMSKYVRLPLAKVVLSAGTTLSFPSTAGICANEVEVLGAAAVTGIGSLAAAKYTGPGTLQMDNFTGDFNNAAFGAQVRLANNSKLYAEAQCELKDITATGTLEKTGRGKLIVRANDTTNLTALNVKEGTLCVTPMSALGGVFAHWDASDATTITTDGDNITRWNSKVGTVYATSTLPNHSTLYGRYAAQKLNGHNVVDFGAYYISGAQVDWAGDLYWNTECSNIAEVFTVAADTPDLAKRFENYTSLEGTRVPRSSPFVGHYTAAMGLRGNRTFDANGNTLTFSPIFAGNVGFHTTSVIELDGTSITYSTPFPAGYHVLSYQTKSAGVKGNAFTYERSSYGGRLQAELLVLSNEVSVAERAAITTGLRTKWLAPSEGTEYAYPVVNIEPGATLECGYNLLKVTSELTNKGSLRAAYVKVGDGATAQLGNYAGGVGVEGCAEVTSATTLETLDLAEGASIKYDLTGVEISVGAPLLVVSARNVTGTPQVTLTGSHARSYVPRASITSDGLVCTLSRSATLINIR